MISRTSGPRDEMGLPFDIVDIDLDMERCKDALTEAYREQRREFRPDSRYCAGILGATNREEWASTIAGEIDGLAWRISMLAIRKNAAEIAADTGEASK